MWLLYRIEASFTFLPQRQRVSSLDTKTSLVEMSAHELAQPFRRSGLLYSSAYCRADVCLSRRPETSRLPAGRTRCATGNHAGRRVDRARLRFSHRLRLLDARRGLLAAGEMAVAYFMMHVGGAPNPQAQFFPLLNHGEPAVLYCWIFLLIFFYGPGLWSLDMLIARNKPNPATT